MLKSNMIYHNLTASQEALIWPPPLLSIQQEPLERVEKHWHFENKSKFNLFHKQQVLKAELSEKVGLFWKARSNISKIVQRSYQSHKHRKLRKSTSRYQALKQRYAWVTYPKSECFYTKSCAEFFFADAINLVCYQWLKTTDTVDTRNVCRAPYSVNFRIQVPDKVKSYSLSAIQMFFLPSQSSKQDAQAYAI